ncbi:BEL1-like homeodomain protein 9 [Euphorbia peplus]|nr:BEL1-like homeodomain protein 9 [Euphorbia peplus]
MAESFEPYHVPQQSRRDKLRFMSQNNPHLGLVFDPTSSDLLAVKEENPNLMAFASSSSAYSPYLDPHLTPTLNPNHDLNGNLFLYTSHPLQSLRDFGSDYNGSDVVVPFKPEPLALSLSSHHVPLELNLERYGGFDGSVQNGLGRSAVPLGPFTGYASILKGSRFLKPAQLLLEEFCDVGGAICSEKIPAMDASLFDPSVECLNGADDELDCSGDNGIEYRRKKSRLISMLDEVYRRYRYYYQHMQAVLASFECVAGLGNAAPYANLALKTMSKHFRSLKNAITDQLQFPAKGHGHLSHGKDEAARVGNFERGLYVQRPQNSGFIDHQPVWRPQRGLPERAVTVLKAWLFEHFLHPYPLDTEKLMLAKQTGLSRSQVSNWFINARVRLWKPMVEEIHMLETRQAQKSSQRPEQNANRSSNLVTVSNLEDPSTSSGRFEDTPSKRSRSDLPDLPSNDDPLPLSYNEPFPMNAAQRFGIGLETSEGLVMTGFEAQNRHFGRDVMEGQLLHDFVG